jgi:hypothetical protein
VGLEALPDLPRRPVVTIFGLGSVLGSASFAARWRLEFRHPRPFGVRERALPDLRKVRLSHQLGQLDQLAGVLLQVPRAERAPEVVRLHVRLFEAALTDPGVEPHP